MDFLAFLSALPSTLSAFFMSFLIALFMARTAFLTLFSRLALAPKVADFLAFFDFLGADLAASFFSLGADFLASLIALAFCALGADFLAILVFLGADLVTKDLATNLKSASVALIREGRSLAAFFWQGFFPWCLRLQALAFLTHFLSAAGALASLLASFCKAFLMAFSSALTSLGSLCCMRKTALVAVAMQAMVKILLNICSISFKFVFKIPH